MSVYPENISACLRSMQNAGVASGANAVGTAANFDCGCFVRLSMRIDDENQSVADIRYTSNGCGYMIAAAEIGLSGLKNRSLIDLHGLDNIEFAAFLAAELGEFPPNRISCREAVFEAITAVFADYRAFRLEEFRGETALICTCFGVSEETIEQFINANLPATVDHVTNVCRAGGGCGSCRFLIQEMIDEASR